MSENKKLSMAESRTCLIMTDYDNEHDTGSYIYSVGYDLIIQYVFIVKLLYIKPVLLQGSLDVRM